MAGAPGLSRSVASGESWLLFMLLTAFTRDGGAEGGGTRPPLGAWLRPSSLDWCVGICDEDVCWRAAAWVFMTCFARDNSFGCLLELLSSEMGEEPVSKQVSNRNGEGKR